ncbi:N-acetyl-L,L-diaminopimelate aminotransferase [Gracilibacillus boraciitolerans JCM 21714]|uniref:Aminotransferase n=1 Tax=Gracilibacillus boraciitolerans JCM 21714 TaxID=1298598 RepID=W4VEJ8_9BACI|nr:aminotransferase A [Gracilibacillus boraciitolerans]GAE91825.1 N-acetyl-L,L-diaminopimelate aminotransferase [Gracilibacillus boraciitolerans JCM 21714]
MEQFINDRVKRIEISGIRQFFNMVADKKDILSLTIGQPDFPTPDHIKEKTKEAIENDYTAYTANAGILSLREAISNFYSKNYQISYDPKNEVIVTVGASQAIDVTFRTLLNEGDEVILPGPVYPGYEPLIILAGAKPVHIDTRETHFKITAEQIERSITVNTKAIIIPYPSNPTGVTLSKEELAEIASVIERHNLFLIADEIYSELVYEQPHFSIGQFAEIRDKLIIINGVSKSHSMTGFRIGYILAPPEWLAKQMLKVHQYNVSCPSSISQYGALEAINNGQEDSKKMKNVYQERRDYVYARLKDMNLATYLPNGGFYFFIDISHLHLDSFTVAVQLAEEAKVALVPGSAFSKYGEGFLRLSYAYNLATIKEGLDRLEPYINNHTN